MTRRRSNAPPTGGARRTRAGAPSDAETGGRTRPREPAAHADLSDEELRALLDDNVDPDELERVSRDAVDDEQEASDHDRDTPRDRLEGLLFEQDDDA
ncbi:MAG TPA: hypothetical protein VFZ70_03180 [Euzebyales bacterium]